MLLALPILVKRASIIVVLQSVRAAIKVPTKLSRFSRVNELIFKPLATVAISISLVPHSLALMEMAIFMQGTLQQADPDIVSCIRVIFIVEVMEVFCSR